MPDVLFDFASYGVVRNKPDHAHELGEMRSCEGLMLHPFDIHHLYPDKPITFLDSAQDQLAQEPAQAWWVRGLSDLPVILHTARGGVSGTLMRMSVANGSGGYYTEVPIGSVTLGATANQTVGFVKYGEKFLLGGPQLTLAASVLVGSPDLAAWMGKKGTRYARPRFGLLDYALLGSVGTVDWHFVQLGATLPVNLDYDNSTYGHAPYPVTGGTPGMRPVEHDGAGVYVNTPTQVLGTGVDGYLYDYGNTGASPTAGSWDAGEIVVYWHAWYSTQYGVLLPILGGARGNFVPVMIHTGLSNLAIDLDLQGISLDELPVAQSPTTAQDRVFDRVRIYRKTCTDLAELWDLMEQNLPPTGTLVADLEWATLPDRWTDTGISKFAGTIGWPMLNIEEGGQRLIYERAREKRAFSVAGIFQGSLVTDAPELGDDVLVFSPPNEPWYNPIPYYIHLSSQTSSTLHALQEIDNKLVAVYEDRVMRVNYLPFVGNTNRGVVVETIHGTQGVVGRNAWTMVNTPDARLLVFLSRVGVLATDGRTWVDFCPNLSLEWSDIDPLYLDQAFLLDDPDRYRVMLFARHTDQRWYRWDMYYHPSHMRQGAKLLGPAVMTAVGYELRGGVSGADTAYQHEVLVFEGSTIQRLYPDRTVGGCEVLSGRVTGSSPLHTLRVQRYISWHGVDQTANTGTSLRMRYDQPGQELVGSWHPLDTSYGGPTDAALVEHAGRSVQIEVRGSWLAGLENPLFNLGPLMLRVVEEGGLYREDR